MSRAPMRNKVPDAHIHALESSSHEQRPCAAPTRSADAREPMSAHALRWARMQASMEAMITPSMRKNSKREF